MEATTRCMNGECATTSVEWRRGWQLRSGGFAVLCHKCGMAYEQSIFCDLFHLSESGWRECISCNKRLHCGCIASKNLVELVDRGGVQCFSCTNNSGPSTGQSETIPEFLPISNIRMARIIENEKSNDVFRVQIGTNNHMEDIFGKGQALQLGKNTEMHDPNKNILSHWESQNESYAQIKREQFTLYTGQMGNTCSGFGKNLMNPNQIKNTEPNFFPSMVEGSRDQTRMISVVQQAQRGHHLLAKPTKMGSAFSEASKEAVSQMRVARPPTDGKGRNQLLPRYWPRITDQELQQISGDSNSTVVPLFEKILSASDAGRMGRLVLPKACTETYFPPISQPEGIPLKIQDAKGKEWNF